MAAVSKPAQRRRHKPRERSGPTAFFVNDDTPQGLAAAQFRRIVLSTGRGDTRLSLAEAYALHDDVWTAIHAQVESETYERAGDEPPKPTRKRGAK